MILWLGFFSKDFTNDFTTIQKHYLPNSFHFIVLREGYLTLSIYWRKFAKKITWFWAILGVPSDGENRV